MNTSFPLSLVSLLAAATLAGCSTTATNADAHPELARATTVAPAPAPVAQAPAPMVTTPNPAPSNLGVMPVAPIPAGEAFYVVRAGDTGTKIAQRNQLTVSDLVALNPGVQWNRLKVGQHLRIHADR